MVEQTEFKDFGSYHASSGKLEARIDIQMGKTSVTHAGIPYYKRVGVGNGDPYYLAKIVFKTIFYDFDYEQETENKFELTYGCRSIKGIFDRLRYNEEGIEQLLAHGPSDRWKLKRNVMKCIIDLEQQIELGEK